jgi:GNAT superfamily N-acetyltransferase
MELRHAEPYEVQALKVLWRTCFGDDWSYINLFFDDFFVPHDMVVLSDGGTVHSMAALLHASIHQMGEEIPIVYLYAMCTHPNQRGKGFGRRLLDYAAEYARLHGAAAIALVPAEPSLFHFYRQAGYENAFWNRTITTPIPNLPLANGRILPVTPAMYNRIRRDALGRMTYVDYSDRFIDHQLQVCALASGGLLRLDLPHGVGCAAVEKGEDGIRAIKELVVPTCGEYAAIALLMKGPRTKAIQARVPARPGEPDARPFGMIKWLTMRRWNMDHAFLGLALD